MTDIDRLREEYEIRHDIEVADAIIAALGDEIAELTGLNIDLEVWRASAVKRAEQAEAEAARLRCCGNCGHRDEETLDYYGSYFVCLTEFKPKTNLRHIEVDCEDQCRFTPSRWQRREG